MHLLHQQNEGISAMKAACKNILYTISDAAGKREIAARAGFDWWRLTYISTQIIFYGCAVIACKSLHILNTGNG